MQREYDHTPEGDTSRPRMLVTQAEYDAATPAERKELNYAVDDGPLMAPPPFVSPVSDPADD